MIFSRPLILTDADRADVKLAREIDEALALRKQMRLQGYVRLYRRGK